MNKDIETGISKDQQLYNMENDPGEQVNLASQYPEKVKEMQTILKDIVKSSGSRPGFDNDKIGYYLLLLY